MRRSAGMQGGELADSKWIFDCDPKVVWPELILSLGPRYAFYATMPRDPSLN